ncbi:MAG: 4Fe-4S dicluster domain-containing protein [Vulcanimicrobiaceae bacterium]
MATGFFTDTTICIGCKACEVACKQWNQLPTDGFELTGNSYDNTVALGGTSWRHVAFVEQMAPVTPASVGAATDVVTPFDSRWLMMSDVCKHCTNAGCLEACPTGAIVRNEFDDVYIQPDICNGCGYCVPSCPFGVVDLISHENSDIGRQFVSDGRTHDDATQKRGDVAGKCTLCYDRQKDGLTPACAKACPTESIHFGEIETLKVQARERVEQLQAAGTHAYLYGVDEDTSVGDLNAFFLLTDQPEVYNLPERPVLPSTRQAAGYTSAAVAASALALVGFALFRPRA